MAAQDPNTTERSVQPRQILASAGLGSIAAAIGYLLSYLIVAGEARDVAIDVANWKVVGWYFFNGHMVDVEATGAIGEFGGSEIIDFIAQSTAATVGVLYLIPPIVLLGLGGLLATRLEAGDMSEAVLAGAPGAIGYVIVITVGALVTRVSTEASFVGVDVSGSIGPQLLPAILLAGLVYPLLFATAGAIGVVVIRSD